MARKPRRGGASRKREYGLLALGAGLCLIWSTSAVHGEPRWRAGPAEIGPMGRAELVDAITEMVGRPDARHVVVQFDQPLTRAQHRELQQAGLKTLRYLGGQAYFASLDARRVNPAVLSGRPALRGVVAVERAWKTDPRILAGHVPAWAVVGKDGGGTPEVGVYVVFHPDVSLATEATAAAQRHGAVIRNELESINALVIEVPLANLDALADEDAVQWIEWPLPRMREINDSNRVITEADIVQAAPYGLDGTGVKVLVYDGGYGRASHVDFQGRLTARDSSGLSNHSTHVAGTIGGAGVANPAYKGMAPGVTIEAYGFEVEGGLQEGFLYSDPGDLEADYTEAINTYGVHISNNSIGSNVESNGYDCTMQGKYGVTAALIDAIVRGSLGAPFRIVWANGNERQGSRCDVEGYGDYYSIAPPSGAKNHITVGALNSNDDSMTYFSSWGPVDDGRMKPDISGPGCQSGGDGGVTSCSSGGDTSYTTMCGTSMAAPTVCGLSALLMEDFRAQFPSDPDPRNSTLKILLAHEAVDLGNTGPDYQYGYGSVRIQQTIDFMRADNFLENQVDQGATFSVLALVSPGDPELKVTLAWDDYPGTPNVDPALVNDLDLRVFDPSSQQHYPWTLDQFNPSVAAVQTQANHVDNLEQVYVASPAVGVWRVEVYGFDVAQGPQPFSVCASPELIACSSTGTIALNASKYPCSATAGIQVIDCDLNTSNSVVETVTVTIESTSEPAGESVLLTETGAETADFRGSISLETVDSAGVLLVSDGDVVTATYIDADDGQGGQNVTVTATADVDCSPPVISNVLTTNIGARAATVTFNTDEPANGTVRYGLGCGALTGSAGESGFKTAHSINLTSLTENTTYYYAVDAVDEAANSATDDNGGACYTFTTPDIPDYFTELFGSDNDLDYLSLTFTPDASSDFYSGCAEAVGSLPVDPSGGTPLIFTPSYDDGYAQVSLSGGETVSLYGTSYGDFWVGTNGYVTFTAGDSDYTESLVDHFDLPRISAVFDDLNPGTGGTVTWKQLADRAVVTWEGVPEYGTSTYSTFQIEMRFNGTIVMSYLDLVPIDGLAGLSEGNGEPADYYESDLSAMNACGEPTCSDGIQNQGEDRIDCGGPCPACDCLSDAACADSVYCNGVETCDAFGHCQSGTAVDCDDGVGCTVDSCNEVTDLCDHDPNDAACDDTLYCNGAEWCHVLNDCQPGTDPCPGQGCDEVNDQCAFCDDNGVCEPGEDCNTCPNDCFTGSGVSCGNGVCETADGEDCTSCSDDCNSRLGGKPNGRYCCGDGTAQYGVDCSDSRCTGAGNTCTFDPAVPSCCGDYACEGSEDSYNCAVDCGPPPVCGDGPCDPGEDQCNCPADCGAPPATEVNCGDGIDNDCDGLTDGADPDCACSVKGVPCSVDGECCSNWCHRGACK